MFLYSAESTTINCCHFLLLFLSSSIYWLVCLSCLLDFIVCLSVCLSVCLCLSISFLNLVYCLNKFVQFFKIFNSNSNNEVREEITVTRFFFFSFFFPFFPNVKLRRYFFNQPNNFQILHLHLFRISSNSKKNLKLSDFLKCSK